MTDEQDPPLAGVTVLEIGVFMAAPFATMLDYPSLSAANAGLVYASASGWGQDGPLARLPGLDIMAQARSGIMSITGTPESGSVKVGVPICDLVCGLYVALAVTAALRERNRTGTGQHVDVSLLEAGVSLAVWEAGSYFGAGLIGGPLGSAHQSQAPYQAFRTADSSRRHARRGELLDAIEARTGGLTTAALVADLEAAGVPCAPMRLARTPTRRGAAGPPLGAHTRDVLVEAGVPAEIVDAVTTKEH